MSDVDTSNRFVVSACRDSVVSVGLNFSITKGEALNLAAYLVALADPGGEEFQKVYRAVLGAYYGA